MQRITDERFWELSVTARCLLGQSWAHVCIIRHRILPRCSLWSTASREELCMDWAKEWCKFQAVCLPALVAWCWTGTEIVSEGEWCLYPVPAGYIGSSSCCNSSRSNSSMHLQSCWVAKSIGTGLRNSRNGWRGNRLPRTLLTPLCCRFAWNVPSQSLTMFCHYVLSGAITSPTATWIICFCASLWI